MDTFDTDVVVAGAGVVGIAIARALALQGRKVLLLEKNGRVGEETSARNSEVIHAGIYYAEGSNKARFCTTGKELLYDYCKANNIGHSNCGKLIVACSDAETSKLEGIAARAHKNGVTDLRFLDKPDVLALEPSLNAEAGLLSPSTGILDSHSLILTMLGEAEANGAETLLRARIMKGSVLPDGRMELDVTGDGHMRLRARMFVNAAGLGAAKLTGAIKGAPAPPDIDFVRGRYFTYSGNVPFKRLIYPVPRDGGLGVHLTLDMAGQTKFGPDTNWLDIKEPDLIDYTVDEALRPDFAVAIRQYWSGIEADRLIPGYSGVRAKIAGQTDSDFQIIGPADHATGQHVFLYGVESPGLTSSLAIANEVASYLQDN